MSPSPANVNILIDNVRYAVPLGTTILHAAEANGIYIPTLCAHAELTPYGGCRMCIVEVEGMRNLPTACTTPAAEGMVVRTHTAQVQAARMEILQLLMSEHTSSCLVCDEKDECRRFSVTVRKVGVTTGCRYCAKDGQCEFQEVAERLGVTTINYPVHYRGMRVEDEDPFYDRDHNLCILCGRCVRICQEVRVADVLGFKNRGRSTVVGPAFERTHAEAGCEFCGACVSVCPTGALSEKARKWEGKPEREERTTCSFCGVGCQMRLRIKGERVIGSLPEDDPTALGGQLCVRGRFCIPELVNDHKRLQRPLRRFDGTMAEITWDAAIEVAAEKLAACTPGHFGMLVSPCLTNEDLYVAQKFARVAMGSHHIDCAARGFYGPAFNAYLDLLRDGAALDDLRKASVILCVGLDTRFGRSPVGVELRRAVRRGQKIVTLHPRDHNLTLIAEKWLRPAPGGELDVLRRLVERTGAGDAAPHAGDDVAAVAALLRHADAPMIVVGSELLQRTDAAELLATVSKLARQLKARILPLPVQNNLLGSILMGAYPELLPGGFPTSDAARRNALAKLWGAALPEPSDTWTAGNLGWENGSGLLYLVGETLPPDAGGSCDYLVYQNIYPMTSPRAADLVLPSAAFTEVDGSYTSGEGRVQAVRKAVAPLAASLPDWEILCRIARKMGKPGFEFSSLADVHAEMSRVVDGFVVGDATQPARPLACSGRLAQPAATRQEATSPSDALPFVLSASAVEHVHRGFALSTWVEGAQRLFPSGVVELSPQDAAAAGIAEGDEVEVRAPGFRNAWRARISPEQAVGELHVTLRHGETIAANPCRVSARKKNV